jgi:CheY-like chemotaxis protein/anti-sigma regulatory factor (Ser/Thr protein kinase)
VRSRSLLLIDADPAVHQLLTKLLQREDRSIQDVYDGSEALALLRRYPCDLVLAGQGRNGFDNLKLLRRVRAMLPKTRVILAGEANPVNVVRAIQDHAYCYFHKPLAGQPVAEMVQQALDADSWMDDIRILSARPEWITIDIRCKLAAAERAIQLTRELHTDLTQIMREDIAASFRELLLNGMEHGAKYDPRKRIRASILRTARSVIVQIQDPGKGFSLNSLPHAAISNPDDSPVRHAEFRQEHGQRPGGFGILMARNMVDELLYNERGNAALFVKYLKRR